VNAPRLVVLAAVLALSGCSVLAPGFDQQKPADTPPPATEQPSEEKKADWPRPCDLYDAGEELPEYGFKITADNVYTCDWTHELGQGKTNVLGVGVWQGLPLEKAAAPPAAIRTSDITIGAHSGKVYEENDVSGGCQLSLVAGDGHVTVHARMQEVEESCDVARKVGEKVEPGLP
jgi:hypothetical protein